MAAVTACVPVTGAVPVTAAVTVPRLGRFAVMAFGGSGVQNEPRVITVSGRIFNLPKKLPQAFDQIKPGMLQQ